MRIAVIALVGCSSSSSMMPPAQGDDDPVPDAAPAGVDAAPVVRCEGKAAQPLDATWTVNGRTAKIHVPASYDPTAPTPVVINLHGLSYTGEGQAGISKMIAKSDRAGFIAIHPNGTGVPRGWNAGDCCNPAAGSGVDDTAFISALIDEATAKLCVDDTRVYATGLSNGGFLAHRLGCELADKIAAFSAVAGVLGIDGCSPSRPIPVFHVHGTSDRVIPYTGGGINGSKSVADTIAFWKTHNGCTTGPTPGFAQGDASCVGYTGCTDGADVTLCTIDGGGHQWPGGMSIGALSGKLSTDLSATDAMWEFFAAHPRR